MAKSSGLGDNLYLAGYDLSGDTNSIGRIGGGPTPWETTGIDKSAIERIGTLRDGGLEWVSYFNPTSAKAHLRLSTLPTTDVIATYCRGTVLGNAACSGVYKQLNYDPTRGEDGSLTFAVSAQPNGYGVEWGKLLTAGQRTDTSATNGTGVDFGTGSTTFGAQAWLHVFAFTGTSVTVTIEESSDNSGDAYTAVTGLAFTAASGITSQRLETSRSLTVERYLRAVTSGTFSSAIFAVQVTRNDTSVTFGSA